MRLPRVLITGGAGYIGTSLTTMYRDKGYHVTIYDNLMYGQSQALFSLMGDKETEFVYGDVRDTKKLLEHARQADIICPLACLVGAPLCKENPRDAKEINTDHVEALCSLPGKQIIYPTTNSGYGVGGDGYCDETSPLNPLSVYGETKVAAEKAVFGSGNIAFRLATVFGASARMRLDLLVNDFVWRAKRDGTLVLFESHFRRNYIHVKDVCRAFLHATEHFGTMHGEVYNVGLSTANLSKLDLAKKVHQYVPNLVIVESAFGQDPDKRDYIVSNAKLEATGWYPKYTLDDGIKELIKLYEVIKAGGDVCRNY